MGLFWNSAAENANIRLAKQAAAGNGPSAARSQLAQGLSQAQNYMSAQAAGVRQNPLAAQRQAQQQGAQMASQANMQSAQLRGQEQLVGQQQLATIAQNDAAAQQALVGGLTSMASTGLAGGLAGMGGKPEDGTTSDVNAKRNIQPAGDRTDALLQSIRPEQYNYRDPARHGQGNRLGVMAQDLQRADPNLVDRQPDGNLAINQPAALSASLAANARLAQRLDALESRTGAAPAVSAAAPDSSSRLQNTIARSAARQPQTNASQFAGISDASRGLPTGRDPGMAEASVPASIRGGVTPEQWAQVSPAERARQAQFDAQRAEDSRAMQQESAANNARTQAALHPPPPDVSPRVAQIIAESRRQAEADIAAQRRGGR